MIFLIFLLLYNFFEYQGPVKCSYLPKYMKYSKMGHRNEIYVKFRTRIDLQKEKLKTNVFSILGYLPPQVQIVHNKNQIINSKSKYCFKFKL